MGMGAGALALGAVVVLALVPGGAGVVAEPGRAGGVEEARAVMAAGRGASPVLCALAERSVENRWGWGRMPTELEDSGGAAVRWAMSEEVGSDAVPVLLEGLRAGDACMQGLAARLLARSDEPSAREGLLEALRSGPVGMRVQAAIGLGLSEAKAALPLLASGLRDPAWQLRSGSAWMRLFVSPRSSVSS